MVWEGSRKAITKPQSPPRPRDPFTAYHTSDQGTEHSGLVPHLWPGHPERQNYMQWLTVNQAWKMPAFCPQLLPEMAESRRVQGQGDENEGTSAEGVCAREES